MRRGYVMDVNLRVIGDVHGRYDCYHRLLGKSKSSIQVGDFGFDYETLSGVDARRHRILGGNHDNYDDVGNWPHFLGDHGIHTVDGFGDIFFVRGGFSLDHNLRTEGISWWANEELSMAECQATVADYIAVMPTFVVSHECPISIVPYVVASSNIIPTKTNQLLERLFEIHQPRTWVFGHYHRSWRGTVSDTQFVCLDELECLDF